MHDGPKHPQRITKLLSEQQEADARAKTPVGPTADGADRGHGWEAANDQTEPSAEAAQMAGACDDSAKAQGEQQAEYAHEQEQLRAGGMAIEVSDEMGTHISVRACGACGQNHRAEPLRRLDAPVVPYTHYFTCPNRLSPVLCTVVLAGKKLSAQDAEILTALAEAMASGRYMVAIYRIGQPDLTSPPKVLLKRITRGFPIEDYDKASGMLAENLAGAKTPAASGPKPAQMLPPVRQLFPGLNIPEGVTPAVVTKRDPAVIVGGQDDQVSNTPH